MILNHIANRVSKGSLPFVISLFTEQLQFRVLRKTTTDVWMRQEGQSVDVQFCETDAPPDRTDKHNSHVAFLSDTPKADLEKLAVWIQGRGHKTSIGSWSEREHYLDVPAVFVDFAIEAMRPELARYDI